MKRRFSSRCGGILNILLIAIVLGVAAFFYFKQSGNSPAALARKQQQDPESGLHFYTQTAYQFTKMENGVHFEQLQRVVTRADYDWFEANYQDLKMDAFGVGGAIDPNLSKALDKRSAMNALLTAGPLGGSYEIINRQLGATEATFDVKYQNYNETVETRRVTMVKEDGVWKMKDFAGQRALLTDSVPREQIVLNERGTDEEDAASAAGPTPTVAPAQAVANQTANGAMPDPTPLGEPGVPTPLPE